jgi:hypothetical protein
MVLKNKMITNSNSFYERNFLHEVFTLNSLIILWDRQFGEERIKREKIG